MRIKITNDLFEIAERAKAINYGYEIYFDTDLQKFVLMHEGNLELIFPFEELDARAIEHIRYSRTENAEQIFVDIDRENRLCEEAALKKSKDDLEDRFSRALRQA